MTTSIAAVPKAWCGNLWGFLTPFQVVYKVKDFHHSTGWIMVPIYYYLLLAKTKTKTLCRCDQFLDLEGDYPGLGFNHKGPYRSKTGGDMIQNRRPWYNTKAHWKDALWTWRKVPQAKAYGQPPKQKEARTWIFLCTRPALPTPHF